MGCCGRSCWGRGCEGNVAMVGRSCIEPLPRTGWLAFEILPAPIIFGGTERITAPEVTVTPEGMTAAAEVVV